MKACTFLVFYVAYVALAQAGIVGRDPPTDGLDNFIVTFNTDEDFIRIGQVEEAQYAVVDDETAEIEALAERYRLHFRIKKDQLKKVEKAIRDHVSISGSANVNFDEPSVEPVPVSIEANPEDQLETGTPDLYRLYIKLPIRKIAKAIGKHVSIHGNVNIKVRFASNIDFDMYLMPAETNYESHGKISMEGGASRGHGGRTEGHIGINGSISF